MGIRHAAVAFVILILAGLTAFGLLGPAVGPERVHLYHVTATIQDGRKVQVREVIDYDFGRQSRHGPLRVIPNDGGAPQEIQASSPDAPANLQVVPGVGKTTLRIGDPNSTVTGRHRYIVSYTLPLTVRGDRFALDAVGAESGVPVEKAQVVVVGAALAGPGCFSGKAASRNRCEITGGPERGYRVEVDGLDAYEGVTVDGDVARLLPALSIAPPPFEGRDDSQRWVWAAIVIVVGTGTALVSYLVMRRIGRNEVAAGGATEAAFGPDDTGPFGAVAPGASTFVADERMAELAGLEFVPPKGVEPWQASLVLRETYDNDTVAAWFSSLAAHDIVVISNESGDAIVRPGPRAAQADAATAALLNQAFDGRHQIELGSYDADFALAWSAAGSEISRWSATSGMFRRRPPTSSDVGGSMLVLGLAIAIVVIAGLVGGASTVLGGILAAVLIPGAVAFLVYRRLTRSLSARGSAVALRAESFRRFLHDSEAQHVEWAWKNGLLREYSAWAVALGEVGAWNRALTASSVPPPERDPGGTLMPALYISSFASTHTAPSSSGGGGFSGGGFSGGGSVGGGGGGGSVGSW